MIHVAHHVVVLVVALLVALATPASLFVLPG